MPNPESFAVFGIWAVLAFCIVILCLILWKQFNKSTEIWEKQGNVIMDFVNTHRKEFTASQEASTKEFKAAMESIASSVSSTQGDIRQALMASFKDLSNLIQRQDRRLAEILLTSRVMKEVEQAKKRGLDIDELSIEKIVRAIIAEKNKDNES